MLIRDVKLADGRLLLPGAIDVHVHFRQPGYSHKELTLVRGQVVYERTDGGERFGEAVGENVRR